MCEWIIAVDKEIIDDLQYEFSLGPIINDRGQQYLTEAVIATIGGLRVEIFSLEHSPPHFRVEYQGETANFDICTGERINGELNRWLRNIRKWHEKNKNYLIEKWNGSRPTDCPVGNVDCG